MSKEQLFALWEENVKTKKEKSRRRRIAWMLEQILIFLAINITELCEEILNLHLSPKNTETVNLSKGVFGSRKV